MSDSFASILYSPEGLADPFPIYAKLRASDPVAWVISPWRGGSWLVTRYADAQHVLNSPSFSSDPATEGDPERGVGPSSPLATILTNSDPPRHTLLRSSVKDYFNAGRVQALRPRISEVANQLVEPIRERGKLDLATEFAFPLPMIMILELLGLPADDSELFLTWSRVIIDTDLGLTPDAAANRNTVASQDIIEYLSPFLDERRRRPQQDLISTLVHSELTDGDTIGMIWLLLSDAFETVGSFIGNAMVALLGQPREMEALRANPELVSAAVDELLRCESSAATVRRYALEDVELSGQAIKKGDPVTVVLISANRDETRFHNPERILLDRANRNHLAFGQGRHACIAAPLARAQCQIGIATLIQRLPGLRLSLPSEELGWRNSFMLRGRLQIPLEFDATS